MEVAMGRSGKILIVDDEKRMRDSLKYLLERVGFVRFTGRYYWILDTASAAFIPGPVWSGSCLLRNRRCHIREFDGADV